MAQPAPPAQQNATPLASPYPDDLAGNLSQLRMGTKSNLKRRKPADASNDGGAAAPSVTTPTAPSPATSQSTGGSGGGGGGGGGSGPKRMLM